MLRPTCLALVQGSRVEHGREETVRAGQEESSKPSFSSPFRSVLATGLLDGDFHILGRHSIFRKSIQPHQEPCFSSRWLKPVITDPRSSVSHLWPGHSLKPYLGVHQALGNIWDTDHNIITSPRHLGNHWIKGESVSFHLLVTSVWMTISPYIVPPLGRGPLYLKDAMAATRASYVCLHGLFSIIPSSVWLTSTPHSALCPPLRPLGLKITTFTSPLKNRFQVWNLETEATPGSVTPSPCSPLRNLPKPQGSR